MQRMCVHHWKIEPANGPTSRGVCQMCKEVRAFANTVVLSERLDWSKIAVGRDNRVEDA